MGADKQVGVALVLSAQNKASMVFDAFFSKTQQKLAGLAKISANAGKAMTDAFAAKKGVDLIKGTLDAYGDVQQAQNELKAMLLRNDGSYNAGAMKALTEQNRKLSESYATVQEAYFEMDKVLYGNRLGLKTIQEVGNSVAGLAYYLKIAPAEAALFTSRVINDLHVAPTEIGKALDTLTRGYDATRMAGSEYVTQQTEMLAMLSPILSTLKVKGLAASETLLNLGAAFTARGLAGATVGTNLGKILMNSLLESKMAKVNAVAAQYHKHLTFFDKQGKYMGIDNMVKQLYSLSDLKPQAVAAIFEAMGLKGGKGNSMLTYLSTAGMKDIQEMARFKGNQAMMQQKIAQMGEGQKMAEERLAQMWRNQKIAFAASIAAPYQRLIELLQKVAMAMEALFNEHPRMAQVATGIIGIASAGAGLLAVINAGRALSGVFKLLGMVGPVGSAVNAFKAVKFGLWAVKFYTMTSFIPSIIAAAVATRTFAVAQMAMARTFMTSVLSALGSASAAVWAFTAALLANPITWVVVGLAVLGAAVYECWKHWEMIGPLFTALWGVVKNAFSSAVNFIYYKILPVFMPQILIFQHWNKIGPYFTSMWGKVKGIFHEAVGWLNNLGSMFYNAGNNIMRSIWGGIRAAVHLPIDAVMQMTEKMRAYLPFSPAKEGALRDIHRIRLVETIAESIRPAAMIKAWDSSISALRGAMNQSTPIPLPFGGSGGMGPINFTAIVHVTGGATQADANMITDNMKLQFRKMMDDYMISHRRTHYGSM